MIISLDIQKTEGKDIIPGNNGFLGTDIDMFIYGLSIDDANKKVKSIIQNIAKNTGKKVNLFVSQHSITVLGIFPYRHVQIVLRLYRYNYFLYLFNIIF